MINWFYYLDIRVSHELHLVPCWKFMKKYIVVVMYRWCNFFPSVDWIIEQNINIVLSSFSYPVDKLRLQQAHCLLQLVQTPDVFVGEVGPGVAVLGRLDLLHLELGCLFPAEVLQTRRLALLIHCRGLFAFLFFRGHFQLQISAFQLIVLLD